MILYTFFPPFSSPLPQVLSHYNTSKALFPAKQMKNRKSLRSIHRPRPKTPKNPPLYKKCVSDYNV
jgi:hypothetical protein